MILKMAETFGLLNGSSSPSVEVTNDRVCFLVDNAIQKARIMSEINNVSKDCEEHLFLLRQNLASKGEDLGQRVSERVDDEITEL